MKILLLSLATLSIQAATYIPTGKVEFTAKGYPTFITIKGTGEGLQGQLDIEGNKVRSARLRFPLGKLKTGMDLRDKHMHDKYLETSKYPMATLELPSFELTESGEVEGELKLHNITKKVKVHFKAHSGETITAQANFKILLEDFAIDIPSFQGITVAKEINLAIDMKANKK